MVIPAVKRLIAIVFCGAMAAANVKVTECRSCYPHIVVSTAGNVGCRCGAYGGEMGALGIS